jgi:hypothetical protein
VGGEVPPEAKDEVLKMATTFLGDIASSGDFLLQSKSNSSGRTARHHEDLVGLQLTLQPELVFASDERKATEQFFERAHHATRYSWSAAATAAFDCLQALHDEVSQRSEETQDDQHSPAASVRSPERLGPTEIERLFECGPLSLAVHMQLADRAAVVGADLPHWLLELVSSGRTAALPVPLRRAIISASAFGPLRAMEACVVQDETASALRDAMAGAAGGAGGGHYYEVDMHGRPVRRTAPPPPPPMDADSLTAAAIASFRRLGQRHGALQRDRITIAKPASGAAASASVPAASTSATAAADDVHDAASSPRHTRPASTSAAEEGGRLLAAHSAAVSRRAVLEVVHAGERGSGVGVIREFWTGLALSLQACGPLPPAGTTTAARAAALTPLRGLGLRSASPVSSAAGSSSSEEFVAPVLNESLWYLTESAAGAEKDEMDTDSATTAPTTPPQRPSHSTGTPLRARSHLSSASIPTPVRAGSFTASQSRVLTLIDSESAVGDGPGQATAYVFHAAGLFPKPLSAAALQNDSARTSVEERFMLIGRAIGKALQDGRVFPMPLAPVFLTLLQRLAGGERLLPTHAGMNRSEAAAAILGDSQLCGLLTAYQPNLADLLEAARTRSAQRHAVPRTPSVGSSASASGADEGIVTIRTAAGHAVEDMCLTFEDPATGADLSAVPLLDAAAPVGSRYFRDSSLGVVAESDVTSANVDHYVAAIIAHIAWHGIKRQMQAATRGVCEVLAAPYCLRALSGSELRDLACGQARVEWDLGELKAHVRASHGYTVASPPVLMLLQLLVTMDQTLRAEFLRFATGSPTLPPGGLPALNPPLSIILKAETTSATVGGYIPHSSASINALYAASGRGNTGSAASNEPEVLVISDDGGSAPRKGASSTSNSSSGAGPDRYERALVSASTCFHQGVYLLRMRHCREAYPGKRLQLSCHRIERPRRCAASCYSPCELARGSLI